MSDWHHVHSDLARYYTSTCLTRLGIGLLLLCGSESGCSSQSADVIITSLYPGDGATAIPSELTGKIAFNEAYQGAVSKIHATLRADDEAGDDTALELSLAPDRRSATFAVTLLPDARYCLSVDVDAQPEASVLESHQAACFTTSVPCGLTVNVGKDATIDAVGGLGSLGLSVLNETLDLAGDDLSIAMILQDKVPGDPFPMTFTGLLTGFVSDEDGDLVIPELGVTSSIPDCAIDAAGAGHCHADEVLVPLSSDGHANTVLIDDADATWEASQWQGEQLTFERFSLRGYATQEAVTETLTSFGEDYAFLADFMDYDLDTDGDGEYDALTLAFSTHPEPLMLEGTTCTPTVELSARGLR